MSVRQLKIGLGKDPRKYAYIYEHLHALEEHELIFKKGKFWHIFPHAQKVLYSILDPPSLKLYLAGAENALQVLRSLPFKIPYLLSVGHYWQTSKFRLTQEIDFASEIFVDSGAQQFFSKFKGFTFPYTNTEYFNFAKSIEADLVATLDLPLDILTPKGLSVKEGIKRTANNGVELWDSVEKGDKKRIVPVLQGFDDATQWLECLDLYRSQGVESEIWGIGSLCMARSSRLVCDVVTQIRDELPNTKIHIFGLALDSLRKVYNDIDSFDTSVWIYWAKMDGVVMVWDILNRRFIHMQARDGKRYGTLSLMRMNIKAIEDMVDGLNSQDFFTNDQ